MNVEKLIQKGESSTVEFKGSLKLSEPIGETISSFSNAGGGTILIGITDSGEIKGVDIGEKTLEKLANRIKHHTDPKIYPSINSKKVDGKDIVIIEVDESPEKPVFYRNRAYKRVGKSTHKLSSSEIRKLAKNSGKKRYWDEQICQDASLEDIDWTFVEETFIPLYEEATEKETAGKPKDILKSLGCIKDSKVTNGGILLFGTDPQQFFRNSYIALARYSGERVGTRRLDYKEFRGDLFQQIDKCNEYLSEHIAVMSRLHPGEIRREDIPEYGRFSIRELLTNAVCHRNYSDQGSKVIIKMFSNSIEFYNPGNLPEGITPENIAGEQHSRNPTISAVLAKVEYIEELGEGWDKIIKEHEEHPLSPDLPKIESSEHSTNVTIFSSKEKFEEEREVELNERQKEALEYIETHEKVTNREYRKINDVSRQTAKRDLSDLVEKDILKQKGKGRGTYYILD